MLLFYVLNNDTVKIEKSDLICSLTLAVNQFSGFFLHASIFSIKHTRCT